MNEPRTYLDLLGISDHRSLESWQQVEGGAHPRPKASETGDLPQGRVDVFRYANDDCWSQGIHAPLTPEQTEELAQELARGIADLAEFARRLCVPLDPWRVESPL